MADETMQVQPELAKTTPAFQLRLWPGVLLVALLWGARVYASTGELAPSKFFFGLVVTPLAVLIGLVVWTLFASRLRWSDRWLIVGTLVAVTAATIIIAGNNFPAMALIMYAIPILVSAWVGWLLVTGSLNWPIRRTVVLLLFVATGVVCSSLRLEGMDGEFTSKFAWRWTPTAEQQHLAELKAHKPVIPVPSDELVAGANDWPGFRGVERDGRLTGVQIKTDWNSSPPKELWRHRIGPGWSSVAVVGDRAFTQEQRGDDEYVVCYNAVDGREIWSHHDSTRFFEVVAGPGPRATPTFHAGRLYVLGANGKLNCLNAATGKPVWSSDIVEDTKAKIPQWGFSSSPLVAHGIVTVFAGAPEGKSLVAYEADSGKLAWTAGEGALSYCSPQLAEIDGVEQILITTDVGIAAFEPITGKALWDHSWPSKDIARVVQPARIGSCDLLIGTGMGVGTRRINVTHEGTAWSVKELWTSRDIKPYYNDLVVYDDHLYGFDGNIFMCVGLKDGVRKWRARGYGNGQVLLLADQGLLLIISEQGEVALVEAQPENHREIGKFKAIDGKTWNHPVVSHGKLFVRNAEEIACFKLDEAVALKETSNPVDQTTEVSPASP